jgi:hypothetical protein
MKLSPSLSFLSKKSIIGMVHVQALPGTPRASFSVGELARIAADEARALEGAGFDAIIIENMHDVPYLLREVGPEIVAAMTAVTLGVRQAVSCPVGVQVLAGANRAALAVALSAGAQFIRAEGFVFSHVADEGLMAEADAGPLLRFRRQIGADQVAILADVKKKHSSHAITADVDLVDTAKAAEFFGAEGLVVTGTATGLATNPAEVSAVAETADVPVLVGSGATPENLPELWNAAAGVIVGSYLKREGLWSNPLDSGRMKAMMLVVGRLRN